MCTFGYLNCVYNKFIGVIYNPGKSRDQTECATKHRRKHSLNWIGRGSCLTLSLQAVSPFKISDNDKAFIKCFHRFQALHIRYLSCCHPYNNPIRHRNTVEAGGRVGWAGEAGCLKLPSESMAKVRVELGSFLFVAQLATPTLKCQYIFL